MLDFEELFGNPESDPDLIAASRALDIAKNVEETMERNEMTRAELAKSIGHSRSYVTKVLMGDANFTLKTLAKLASALECKLNVSITPLDAEEKAESDDLFASREACQKEANKFVKCIEQMKQFDSEKHGVAASKHVNQKIIQRPSKLVSSWNGDANETEQSAA